MLGIDYGTIYIYIEDATPASYQFDAGLKFALQLCSQTGRFGFVASGIAVGNLYVHIIADSLGIK